MQSFGMGNLLNFGSVSVARLFIGKDFDWSIKLVWV